MKETDSFFIREGFVISYSSKFGKSSFCLFFSRKDNNIIDIGYDDFHTVSPFYELRAQAHDALHYVLEGRGTLVIGDKTFSLSPGWVFVLPADVPVSYYPDAENPWSYVWFGFEGSLSQMVSEIGFSAEAPLFRMPKPKEINDLLSNMIQRAKNDTLAEYLFAKSAFLRIISDIAAKKETDRPSSSPHRAIISETLSLIEANYRNPALSVEMLCSIVHVSHSYLCKVFLKETGMTMRRAIIQQRMRAAKVLLSEGQTPREAAEQCGYRDIIHFAKEFRRYTGEPPAAFRKKALLEKQKK